MVPVEPNPSTPPRSGSTATAIESLVSDLLKQLETANKTILELGMKGAALQKELDMRKQFEDDVWFPTRDELADYMLTSNQPVEDYKPMG